jgi:hypothetical protein
VNSRIFSIGNFAASRRINELTFCSLCLQNTRISVGAVNYFQALVAQPESHAA